MAIKVVEHSPGARESLSLAEQKIEREALLATSLSHPNIIATFKICTMTAGAMPVPTVCLLRPPSAEVTTPVHVARCNVLAGGMAMLLHGPSYAMSSWQTVSCYPTRSLCAGRRTASAWVE